MENLTLKEEKPPKKLVQVLNSEKFEGSQENSM